MFEIVHIIIILSTVYTGDDNLSVDIRTVDDSPIRF